MSVWRGARKSNGKKFFLPHFHAFSLYAFSHSCVGQCCVWSSSIEWLKAYLSHCVFVYVSFVEWQQRRIERWLSHTFELCYFFFRLFFDFWWINCVFSNVVMSSFHQLFKWKESSSNSFIFKYNFDSMNTFHGTASPPFVYHSNGKSSILYVQRKIRRSGT